VSRALLPPSPGRYFRRLDPSVGGSGPHDFAVRDRRIRLAHRSRPSHPAPTFVTTRTPLLSRRDGGGCIADLGLRRSGIFFSAGLDNDPKSMPWPSSRIRVLAQAASQGVFTLPWRGRVDRERPRRREASSGGRSGWADLVVRRAPHPVTHIASLFCVPTLPLQGRVKSKRSPDEPTGRADARPMTGSAKQSRILSDAPKPRSRRRSRSS
jgi:hypothetical protein